jgi:hypothetical protein
MGLTRAHLKQLPKRPAAKSTAALASSGTKFELSFFDNVPDDTHPSARSRHNDSTTADERSRSVMEACSLEPADA